MVPTSRLILTISVLFSLAASAALAHHGFTGAYDASRPVWLSGTIRTAQFQYPHAIVEIAVSTNSTAQRPDNANFLAANPAIDTGIAGTTVRVEFPPIARFNSLEGRLRSGDAVSMIVYRNCRAPNQLRVQWIRLRDGTEVVRSGQVQTEVTGCPS